MVESLSIVKDRSEFYHIKIGSDVEDYLLRKRMVDQDNYGDVFRAEEHCAWIAG